MFGKQGITFMIFFLSAKMLSPHDFGIYSYALTAVLLLTMMGDFGISTATAKYVAEYNLGKNGKVNAVLFNTTIMIIVLAGGATALMLTFGRLYFGEIYVYVLYLIPLAFLVPLTSLYDGIYRGLKRFRKLALISLGAGLISIFFSYISIRVYGLEGALVAQNAIFLLLLIGLSLGYKGNSLVIDTDIMKTIGKFSLMIGLATTSYFLFSRVAVFVLGKSGYLLEIATYEVLSKLVGLAFLPFAILASVLVPNIAEYYSIGEYGKIYTKFIRYTLVSALCAGLIGLLSYFVYPLIIDFLLPNYRGEIFAMMLVPVLLSQTALIYSSLTNNLIILSPLYARRDMFLKGVLALLNIPACIYLLNKIGYVGPIYATTVITIIGIVYLQGSFFFYIRSKAGL